MTFFFRKLAFTFLQILTLVQTTTAQNFVPNSSFEQVEVSKKKWNLNDMQFEQQAVKWLSPNAGSPDLIDQTFQGNFIPIREGYDLSPHKAKSGNLMAAIKTFGCNNTAHCKEYLQIKLTDPMIAGQNYYLEFWVNPMSSSLYTNNLGAAFTLVEIDDDSKYGLYYLKSVVNEKRIMDQPPNSWHKIHGNFTAERDFRYLLIGNFFTDEQTQVNENTNSINHSYYFIDDIFLMCLDCEKEIALNNINPEAGNRIVLQNIHFRHNQAKLMKSSFATLDSLLKFMNEHPDIKVEVSGHTDNEGDHESNIKLSEARAKSVIDYLKNKGLDVIRLEHKGFGETQPLMTNDTEEGRRLNRRVEIRIIDSE